MVQYDPAVIQAFAESLYAKSLSIARSNAFLGAIVGSVAGFALSLYLNPFPTAPGIAMLLLSAVGGVLSGAIGYRRGMDKSFFLRLHAQLTLCQLMVEANTRNNARVNTGQGETRKAA